MSYPEDKDDALTFASLRKANLDRLPQFRDKNGKLCHTHPHGFDWSPADWMTAVAGEVGELAGVLKSLRRGDFDHLPREEVVKMIANESSDIVIYLDILNEQFGIDLGEAIRSKFNEVSVRVQATTKL